MYYMVLDLVYTLDLEIPHPSRRDFVCKQSKGALRFCFVAKTHSWP